MGGDHLWEEVGALGQVLGSIAVFVSLIYVATQVRHARSEAQRSVAENRALRSIHVNMALATNERLLAIHVKGNDFLRGDIPRSPFMEAWATKSGLSLAEAVSLHTELFCRWENVAQSVLYIEELDAGTRAQFNRSTRFVFSEPVFRLWFDLFKPNLNPDVVRYVDNLLAERD